MALAFVPRQMLVDANGVPRVAAELYYFQAGTSTPITVYTTAAYAVAHPSPVVSVSGGFFPAVYVNPAVNATYKVVAKDAAGNTILTEDNVPALGFTASDVGSTLYPRTAAEVAAAVTPTSYAYAPGDVRRYGAVGDAVTDDTAAIQATIAVSILSGIPWYVPAHMTCAVATTGSTTSPVGAALTIASSCKAIIDGTIRGTNNCNVLLITGDDVTITGRGRVKGYGTFHQSGANNGACIKNTGSRCKIDITIEDPPQYGIFYTSATASGGEINALVLGGPTSMSGNQHYGIEIEGPWRGLRIPSAAVVPNAAGTGRCVQGLGSGANGGTPINITLGVFHARSCWDHGTYLYCRNSSIGKVSVSGTGGSGIRIVGTGNAVGVLSSDDCSGGGVDLLNFAGGSVAAVAITDYASIGLSLEQLDAAADDSMSGITIGSVSVRGKAATSTVRCGLRILGTFSGTTTNQRNIQIGNLFLKDACQSSTAEGALRIEVGSAKVFTGFAVRHGVIDTPGYNGVEIAGGGTLRDSSIEHILVRNPGANAAAAGSDTHGFRIAAGTTMEFGSLSNCTARDDRGGGAKMAQGFSVGGTATLVRFKDNDSIGHTSAIGTFIGSGDYAAGDTTPSVRNRVNGGGGLHITNGSATTITNLDDMNEGDTVVLTFADGNTTVDRANAALSGGVNFTSTANDSLTLTKRGSTLIEVARGVNS